MLLLRGAALAEPMDGISSGDADAEEEVAEGWYGVDAGGERRRGMLKGCVDGKGI